MPFKRLAIQPSPEEPVMIPRPAPPKLGALAEPSTSLLADMRMDAIWKSLMERSWTEAVDKLKSVVKDDFHEDPSQVDAVVPCIVDQSEGRTKRESEAIARVQRREAKLFAGLVDRLVRYRPESHAYAFDWLKDEEIHWKPLYRNYVCEEFRKPEATETDTKKGKGKKK